MRLNPMVLVIGTTSDYIEWIRRACPGRACFVTDLPIRQAASEPTPSGEEELLCDLSNHNQVRLALQNHLKKWDIYANGIVCYDCESMELAARLAQEFLLPYHSIRTIHNCRDKYASKVLWRENGIQCPEAAIIRTQKEAVDFFRKTGGLCVIKPLTGSGSELVHVCASTGDCKTAVSSILQGLNARRSNRLYRSEACVSHKIIAEEHISGPEYSCDFLIESNHIEIIRLTRKIPFKDGPFGTTRGYVLENRIPEGIEPEAMEATFKRAAQSLGIRKAICMVDFIVRGNEVVLLEMAPRPGGDCIPFLLKRAMGLDILKLAMNFTTGRYVTAYIEHDNMPCVGLRIHAKKGGIIRDITAQRLEEDSRVMEVILSRKPGHLIRMPPDDYESWVLGHLIFRAEDAIGIEEQCDELMDKLNVEIE